MQAGLEQKIWTDEELMALPDVGQKYELVGGQLVMSPAGFRHGYISLRLASILLDFVTGRRLGVVVDSSTGFRLSSGNVRSPDISFVRNERLQNQDGLTQKFFRGAPDLAVEVLSPDDTVEGVHQKLTEYFQNVTSIAWVINPGERTVLVYRSIEPSRLLRATDQLEGEDVLPGFTFPVERLFEVPDFGV